MIIGECAFWDCTSLKSIKINVLEIGSAVFSGCKNLIEVSIGKDITKLGACSFEECTNIKDFYCYAKNPPITDKSDFGDGSNIFIYKYGKDQWGNDRYTSYTSNINLHVPESAVNLYNETEPWKDFKNIVALTDTDPKPSGINNIIASGNNKGIIYDLSGHRVSQPAKKGLYIQKGKKFVVK